MRFLSFNIFFLTLIIICILPLDANDKELLTRLEALEKKVSSLETEIRSEEKTVKDFLLEMLSEYYELIPDELRTRIQTRFNITIKAKKKED